jgi:peptide/nickel transport system substrate-binding protein
MKLKSFNLLLIAALFLAACAGAAPEPTTAPGAAQPTAAAQAPAQPTDAPKATTAAAPATAPAAAPAANKTDTLRLIYYQGPTILNPHLAAGIKDYDASRIFYEPLATYNSQGEMILFLAKEAPTVENGGLAKDGTSVTWKLKEGVKWHDGKPFTADDVVFTYEYLSNPKVGATTLATYKGVKSVEAVDPATVKITFTAPSPSWNLPFVGQQGMIIPRHVFEQFANEKAREAPANLKPVGTGPFMVTEFKPGDLILADAFADYWDKGKPYFKHLMLKGGGDATSAARAVMQTSEADYAYDARVEAKVMKELVAAGKGKIITDVGPYVERILLNYADPVKETDGERASLKNPHPFFTDVKVREAFKLAIDRKTIAEQLYGGQGVPTCNYLIVPPQYASKSTTCDYDLEKAKSLLDQAGWKVGNDGVRAKGGVKMSVVFQTSVSSVRQKTQEIIKQALESIGVKVQLKSIDGNIFFSGDPANPDTFGHFYADMEEYNDGGFSPDPAAYMRGWTCAEAAQKANQWAGKNYTRYCSKEYDKLFDDASKELDPQKRAALFVQMNDLLVQKDVAVITIVNRLKVGAVSNNIIGVVLTAWDGDPWMIKDWKPAK